MTFNEPFRVLLAEDDEVDIQSVQRSLRKLNKSMELDVVKNGLEALQFLYQKNKEGSLPDLIILDINMPKMSGIEFLKKMRADLDFNVVNVIILSTSNDYHDKAAVLNLNIAGYFLKPLQADEFLSLCQIILG